MSSPNSPKAAHSTLEASISSLSLHSKESGANEDWDQSMRVERPSTPNGVQSAEPTTVADPQSTTNGINGVNGGNFGTRGRKFGEMLRRHAEQGRSLNLSDEDEENLSEELGKWINSDSSPYELDDGFFPPDKNDTTRSRAGSSVERPTDSESQA